MGNAVEPMPLAKFYWKPKLKWSVKWLRPVLVLMQLISWLVIIIINIGKGSEYDE